MDWRENILLQPAGPYVPDPTISRRHAEAVVEALLAHIKTRNKKRKNPEDIPQTLIEGTLGALGALQKALEFELKRGEVPTTRAFKSFQSTQP